MIIDNIEARQREAISGGYAYDYVTAKHGADELNGRTGDSFQYRVEYIAQNLWQVREYMMAEVGFGFVWRDHGSVKLP